MRDPPPSHGESECAVPVRTGDVGGAAGLGSNGIEPNDRWDRSQAEDNIEHNHFAVIFSVKTENTLYFSARG